MQKDWTVQEMLNWTSSFFKSKNIDEYRLDSEVLLAHVIRVDRLSLYLSFDRILKNQELAEFKDLIKKRTSGFSVAAIIGEKEFMGLKFIVNSNVLIPRPETEILVEEVLDVIKNNSDINTVVDIFTGSGNIPISIANYVDRQIFIYGVDISEKAIEIAEENCYLNKVLDKVRFFRGDMFDPLLMFPLKNRVDIITANPPYIKTSDITNLQQEVQNEPLLALDGGEDGLFFYEKLIKNSIDYLRYNGYIFMETDPSLVEEIKIMLNPYFCDIKIKKDYQNLDRIIIARRG